MEQGKEIQVDNIFNNEKMEGIKEAINDYKIKQREIELKKLGFELNNDQRCFHRWKYNSLYIFDFYDVENLSDVRWSIRIEDYKKYLQKSKEELENSELYLLGFNSAQKEFKTRLKDKYNHLNSKLKEVNTFKLDKTVNQETRIRLESQVKLLKELMKICG